MKTKALVFGGLTLSLLAGQALAHHSFAMFDADKMITKTGTVKELEWTNPHVWLHIMAADDTGKPTISMHDENVFAERVLRAGGRGYVSNQASGPALIAAIRAFTPELS